jgi:hypothetical protein
MSVKCANRDNGVRCPITVLKTGQLCSFHRHSTHSMVPRRVFRCVGKQDDGASCFMRVRGEGGLCPRHRPQSDFAQVVVDLARLRSDFEELANTVARIGESLR